MGDIASGAISSLFNLGLAKAQQKGQKNLMALQWQYDQNAFDKENERQNWLLQHQVELQKKGLLNAGLSPAAAMDGSFSNVATNSLDTPGAPSFSIPNNVHSDIVGSYGSLSQAKYIDSQTELNKIEARYRARKLGLENEALQQEIDQKREQWPLLLQNLQADLDKKVAEKELTEDQSFKLYKDLEVVAENLRGLKLANDFSEKTLEERASIVSEQLREYLFKNKIHEAEALLAQYGILIGADGLTNLASILLRDKDGELSGQLAEGLAKLLEAFPSAVGTVLQGVGQSAKNAYHGVKGWFKKHFEKKRED